VEADDGGMSDIDTTRAAEAFIALEADMLDHCEYEAWLGLWADDGRYVIPIGDGDDFEDRLNYAFDDAAMRRMRVARLTSGQSMSANDAARTVRVVGRFRALATDAADAVTIRCAQTLTEYRREAHRTYAANVTFKLARRDDSFVIVEKVVRLINSDGALAGLTYLL
jgi:3-phenylpropionate/cinnamic acid dioxygenase small subunit